MPPRKDIPGTRKSKRGNRPPLPFRTGISASASASASGSGSASESASVAPSASASSPAPNLGSSSPSLETQTRKRSWNAPIWQHYETHDGNEFDDLVPRAICKYCGGGPIKAYAEKGTSNFRRHFETCSSRLCGAKGELILASDGKLIRKVDQSFYKEMVCLSIIRHNYPFIYTEHEGTRDVHRFLNENCKPFCRNTAKNYVLKIHKREKENLRGLMSKLSGRICLTSDMWTSCVDQGFMSLTAHFIDDDWNLHCKILNFCPVEPPHTALVLHDTVFGLLKDWGIHKKVFTMTLDNARCNDNMQSMLSESLAMHSSLPCGGKYFHVRCSAHILNLIVEEGLKVVDIGVKKIKKMVCFVGSSERRTLQFKEIALSLGLDCSRNLCLDCPTRWNSTFKMLQRALLFRMAFSSGRMVRVDSRFPPIPTDEEWNRIEKICDLLKPFDELTTLMSGRIYPTSNLYFRCVWKVELLLLKYVACGDTVLMDIVSRMKKKFDKYWSSYSLILSFAMMLDPRYKFQLIQHCFEKLDVESASLKSNHVKEEFMKLFQEYSVNSEATMTRAMIDPGDFEGFATVFDISAEKSEVDIYLDETRENPAKDLDVLDWWKKNTHKFPSVSRMARDILAIPITTVASESAFSMGSRVITRWRYSLLAENAEALLTTRSWIYGLDIEGGPEENLEEGLEVQFTRLHVDNGDETVEMED